MKKKKGKYQSQSQNNLQPIVPFVAFGVLIVLGVSSFAFFKVGEHAAQSRQETEPQMILETISQPQETAVAVAYQLEPEIPETTVSTEESAEATVAAAAPTEHTQPATETTQPQVLTGTVLRSAGELNVRSGPGTNYSQVGRLKGGDAVTVYEQQTSNGKTWGNIGNGWVSMDYVVFGVDNSSYTPSNTTNLAEYAGEWISSDQLWYLRIIQSGNGVNLYAEYPYHAAEKTVWTMQGEYEEHTVIRYWSGICKISKNGYESVSYSNGEGAVNFCASGVEWHDFTENRTITLSRMNPQVIQPQPPANNGGSSQNNNASNQSTSLNISSHPWHDEFESKIITYVVKSAGGSNAINGDRWRCKMTITSIKDLGDSKFEVQAEGSYNKDGVKITAIFEEGVINFDFGWLGQPGDRYVTLRKCTSLVWSYNMG